MFCKNCGAKLEEGTKFCSSCGKQVEVNTTEIKEEVVETKEEVREEVKKLVNEQVEKVKSKKTSILPVIFVLLAVALLIGGGIYYYFFMNKSNAYEVMEKAINNMSSMKNFTMSVNADIKAKSEEQDVEASANIDMSMNIDKKLASLNAKASAMGFSLEIPAYLDLSDSTNAVAYFKLSELLGGTGDWSKISLGEIDLSEVEVPEEEFKFNEEAKTSELLVEKKSDIEGTRLLVMVLNKENIEKINKDSSEQIDFSQLEEIGLEDGFNVNIYVNKKDNYIQKITIDLSGSEAEGVSFEKFNISFEIKDYGKEVNITIPEEALNATDFNVESEPSVTLDNSVSKDSYSIEFTVPEGYEMSDYSDEQYKYYSNDDVDVTVKIVGYGKDIYLENIDDDKKFASETENYSNASLTDEEQVVINNVTFGQKILTYYYSEYKVTNVYLYHELDDNHLFIVEAEAFNNEINMDEIKQFLNVTPSGV